MAILIGLKGHRQTISRSWEGLVSPTRPRNALSLTPIVFRKLMIHFIKGHCFCILEWHSQPRKDLAERYVMMTGFSISWLINVSPKYTDNRILSFIFLTWWRHFDILACHFQSRKYLAERCVMMTDFSISWIIHVLPKYTDDRNITKTPPKGRKMLIKIMKTKN